MVDRAERSHDWVALEHRKIHYPQKTQHRIRNEIYPPRDVLPHAIERRARHAIRPGDKERELALGEVELLVRALRKKLGNRPIERAVDEFEPQQSRGAG